jgi:hypothetical protein
MATSSRSEIYGVPSGTPENVIQDYTEVAGQGVASGVA